MQHSRARLLNDLTGWHWVDTHSNDCRSRGCFPHPTIESAQRCQWEAELATAREFEVGSARECVECRSRGISKVWTSKGMQMGGYMGQFVFLCDLHRTVDVLRKHTVPPVERWQS